ncbi:hypothetical protein CCR75_000033 [Bremia lactucae]|uniref:Essential protein Yae1 N-terminal domain-containing protein n=1 Tax=Bremia lactucae TaxID=4779 RepID=A0A976NZS2_BRELC|nr:hypothetical protein CCR75_000033 [Bremia lactucae]
MNNNTASPLANSDADDGFQDCVSEDEENETMLYQESIALVRRMQTLGIRDGLELGKEETLQEGFDKGYAESMARSFRFARLRGALGTAVACGLFESDTMTHANSCMLRLRELEIGVTFQANENEGSVAEKLVKQAIDLLRRVSLDMATDVE